MELYTRREILYQQATKYYFVYYIIIMGKTRKENSTNDLGLIIVNAWPLIHQTDL